MTRLDLQVLDYVRTHIERTGVAPTIREIGAAVGQRGMRGVYNSLSRLIEEGRLRRSPNRSRGLSLADAPDLAAATTEALKAELGRRGVTGAALERPERVAIGPARHCAVAGCGEEVPMGHAFCLSHWRAISTGSQRVLMDAHGLVRRLRSGRERDMALAAYQAAYSQALVEAERRDRPSEARDWNAVDRLLASAIEVMAALDKYGPAIVPHLMDSDDNAGERLRCAIDEIEHRRSA